MWPRSLVRRNAIAAKLLGPLDRPNWRADPERLPAFAGLRPVIVITGGSEGIGRAIADEFASLGRNLLLIARRNLPLQSAAEAIRERHQVAVHTLPLDLTAGEAVETLDGFLAANGLYADILVNNAAIGLAGPFSGHDAENLDRMIALNIAALTRLTRAQLPGMIARGEGGILNLASVGGLVPGPNQAAYYASKAYVIALSEALSYEVTGTGVRICCVAPGPVSTAFHQRMNAGRALYQRLPGRLSREAVARAAVRGYLLAQPLTVPGLVQKVNAIALRLLPRTLTIPIMAELLKRRQNGN